MYELNPCFTFFVKFKIQWFYEKFYRFTVTYEEKNNLHYQNNT